MTKKTNETEGTKKPTRRRRKLLEDTGPLSLVEEYKDPNYVYRWCKDKDWNLQVLQDRGYEFETNEQLMRFSDARERGSQISDKITVPSGDGHTMYLMRIPKEYHEEDMADKRRINNENISTAHDIEGVYEKDDIK
jgi:hypothetical protein